MAVGDGMKRRAASTAETVNAALAEQEADAILHTAADLAALKPKVSDSAAYERLIQAVNESTRRNESVAEFKDRIQKLGSAVVKVAKEVSKLV